MLGIENGRTVNSFNNNQQEGKVNILNSGAISSEKEMYELRIEELKNHIAAIEQTCADLRQDKDVLRAEVSTLMSKLVTG
ncbi:MAG: hypothetical protein SFV22_18125 [Saprospiraceae bacterium]|nr:hypothetical protein [Saprospiraceae bacterium]